MKSVQIWSFFWSAFSCIRAEYGDLLRKSPYSVQVQEIQTRKKLRIWTLSPNEGSFTSVTDLIFHFLTKVPRLEKATKENSLQENIS